MERPEIFAVEETLRRIENDVEVLQEACVAFLGLLPESLHRIEQAIKEKDSDALVKASHFLKASLMNLGAKRAQILALELETLGHSGKIEDGVRLNDLYSRLCEEVAQFQQAITSYLKDLEQNRKR